jgi:ketosteroid isomerase-like protein
MASMDLDLVRSICAAWGRGDFSSAEWADPEIEFVVPGEGPSFGSWTGLADLAGAMRNLRDTWEHLRIEVEEYRELEDKRVLVLIHFSGRGKTSGLELDQMGVKAALVFNLSAGRVIRLVYYVERELALADLGLAPEADSSAP